MPNVGADVAVMLQSEFDFQHVSEELTVYSRQPTNVLAELQGFFVHAHMMNTATYGKSIASVWRMLADTYPRATVLVMEDPDPDMERAFMEQIMQWNQRFPQVELLDAICTVTPIKGLSDKLKHLREVRGWQSCMVGNGIIVSKRARQYWNSEAKLKTNMARSLLMENDRVPTSTGSDFRAVQKKHYPGAAEFKSALSEVCDSATRERVHEKAAEITNKKKGSLVYVDEVERHKDYDDTDALDALRSGS